MSEDQEKMGDLDCSFVVVLHQQQSLNKAAMNFAAHAVYGIFMLFTHMA